MKKEKFLKLNILCVTLTLLISMSSNAAVIYSPGSGGNTNSPLNDPVLNPKINSGSVTDIIANQISQINVADSSTNIAEPLATPNATINTPAATTTANIGTSPLSNITEAQAKAMQSMNVLPNVSSSFTKKTVNTEKEPTLSAPAYILINATTNSIYTEKEMDAEYDPAGLVNLMTAYLAVNKLDLDAVLNVKSSAVIHIDKDASIADLAAGDKITLKDAIASIFIKGCVDSANVIAENVSGSIDEFVKLMNETATTLGLTNTRFVNPSGINNESQHSSAKDMAILMAKVCENPELVKLLSLSQYTLPASKNREKLIMYSKNSQLLSSNSTYNADVVASRMGYNKMPLTV